MSELSDRLFILILSFVGFGGFFIAIVGSFVMADLHGPTRHVVIGALTLLILATLVGIWFEFNNIDRGENDV